MNIDKYTLEELKGVLKDNPKLPPEAKSVIEKAIEMKSKSAPKKATTTKKTTTAKPKATAKKTEKPTAKEVKDFVEYVGGFYGKKGIYAKDYNGGFTVAQIKSAVNKYIKDSKTVWGGGDSVDRELMRDRFLVNLVKKKKPTAEEKAQKKQALDKATRKTIEDCEKILAEYKANRMAQKEQNKDRLDKLEKKGHLIEGTDEKTLEATTETVNKEVKPKIEKEVKAIVDTAEKEAKKEVSEKGKTKEQVEKEVKAKAEKIITKKVDDMTKDLAKVSANYIKNIRDEIRRLGDKKKAQEFLIELRKEIDLLLKAYGYGGAVQSYDIAWAGGGRPMPMFEKGGKFADGGYVVGDKVKMFEDEPPLTITAVDEFYDGTPNRYNLKSDDGKINRRNISETKIKEFAKGGKFADGGMVNKRFLENQTSSYRDRILKSIANHYGTTTSAIKEELYDKDAEMIYEYIGNDRGLRMKVYEDMQNYSKGGEIKETSSQFKKRSEKDSLRIYKAWKKVLDSDFEDKEYQRFEKLVKDTQIPKEGVRKIQDYTSTTPRGSHRLIDIYQYWGKSHYDKGGQFADGKKPNVITDGLESSNVVKIQVSKGRQLENIKDLENVNFDHTFVYDTDNNNKVLFSGKYNKRALDILYEIEEQSKGGKFADGGEVSYDSILDILKESLEDAVEDVDYENSYSFNGKEIEHKSRDGFIAYTDGGYTVEWFEYLNYLRGSGRNLPTSALENEAERQYENNIEYALERFKEENEELVEEIGEDKINYNDLYELGYESEAEELSEMEMEMGYDDSVFMDIQALYYLPSNDRGVDGKNTIRLSGAVNLESPYHRRGNLEDYIEIEFTFDTLDELNKKMSENIVKIVDWFNGYEENDKVLKIRRMAKGGKFADGGRYSILGVSKSALNEKPTLHSSVNKRSEIKKAVAEAKKDFKELTNQEHDIFVTDNEEDRQIYNYSKGGKVKKTTKLGWKRDRERLSKEPHEQAYKPKRKGSYTSFAKGGELSYKSKTSEERNKLRRKRQQNAFEMQLSQLKNGQRKTIDQYFVQGNYGQGWEDLTTHDLKVDAMEEKKVYDKNESYPHRVVTKRIRKEDYLSGNYAKGGSVDEVRIYVADLEAYNNGQLKGGWLDLTDYSDGSEVMEAIDELIDGEEYAIHDYEGFPSNMYSEYMGEEDFDQIIQVLELEEYLGIPMHVILEFMSDNGIDDIPTVQNAYYGEYDDAEDFAYRLVEEGVMKPNPYDVYVSDTDKRIIAGEEEDRFRSDAEYDSELSEEEIDERAEEIYDEWYNGLDSDPIDFLVNEQGIYSEEDALGLNFINIDYEKVASELEYDHTFIEGNDGQLYVFMNNYAKGGKLKKKPYNRSYHMDRKRLSKEKHEQAYLPKRKKSYFARGGEVKFSSFLKSGNFDVTLPNGKKYNIEVDKKTGEPKFAIEFGDDHRHSWKRRELKSYEQEIYNYAMSK